MRDGLSCSRQRLSCSFLNPEDNHVQLQDQIIQLLFHPKYIYTERTRITVEYEDDIKVIINSTQLTIQRKIRGNFQESFTGKSRENVDSNSEEFLVTHSKEFLITRSEEFLETHSEEFLITPAKEFLAIILLINSPKNSLHGDQVLDTRHDMRPLELKTSFIICIGCIECIDAWYI